MAKNRFFSQKLGFGHFWLFWLLAQSKKCFFTKLLQIKIVTKLLRYLIPKKSLYHHFFWWNRKKIEDFFGECIHPLYNTLLVILWFRMPKEWRINPDFQKRFLYFVSILIGVLIISSWGYVGVGNAFGRTPRHRLQSDISQNAEGWEI